MEFLNGEKRECRGVCGGGEEGKGVERVYENRGGVG